MSARAAETATMTEERPNGAPPASALCLLLESTRPSAGSESWDLSDVELVQIGRGPARRAIRDQERLELSLPETRLSSRHARLVRLAGGWVLEDLGSKNGTRLDGQIIRRARVAPGAMMQLGGAFLQLSSSAVPASLQDSELITGEPGLISELARLRAVASSRVPVLILGESGTGKELTARFVHKGSGRAGKFVAVNCGGLPATLIEAELFGHKRGAFSGAIEDRLGFIRSADRGTLFLDEIGDLPAPAQAALLRTLQEQEVVPVGESHPVRVDVRVIAATHHDLDRCVERGQFRADLLARLDGHRARLPPLRERTLDLGNLIATIVRRVDPRGAADVSLSAPAARALLDYPWPRNVRELEQALSSALALARGRPVELEDLPEPLRKVADEPKPARASTAPRQLSDEEQALRDKLVGLLTEERGNLAGVARALSKDRTQVRRWLSRLGLVADDYR